MVFGQLMALFAISCFFTFAFRSKPAGHPKHNKNTFNMMLDAAP